MDNSYVTQFLFHFIGSSDKLVNVTLLLPWSSQKFCEATHSVVHRAVANLALDVATLREGISTNYLAMTVTLGICFVLVSWRCWAHTNVPLSEPSLALETLLSFVTPTRSIWPSSYIDSARSASSNRDKIISLSLTDFLDDMVSGRMELRDSKRDLPNLIKGNLHNEDWSIRLRIEWSWWFRVWSHSVARRLASCGNEVS